MQKRTPKNYDGVEIPSKQLKELLEMMVVDMDNKLKRRPKRVIETWKEIAGPKLVLMTEVISFNDGILEIKVKNSILFSLLCQHEKERLLKSLQGRFSKKTIRNIIFRIG